MNLSVQGPAASSSAVPARVPPAATERRRTGRPAPPPSDLRVAVGLASNTSHVCPRHAAKGRRKEGKERAWGWSSFQSPQPRGAARPAAMLQDLGCCFPLGGSFLRSWVVVAPLPSPPGVPSRRCPNTPRCCCPPRPPLPAASSFAGAGNWRRGEPWASSWLLAPPLPAASARGRRASGACRAQQVQQPRSSGASNLPWHLILSMQDNGWGGSAEGSVAGAKPVF